MATNKANPALASQTERVRRRIGVAARVVAFVWIVHRERPKNSESIIASRQSRAERRWTRLNARPRSPVRKATEKAEWVAAIRQLWTLTTSF